LREDEGEEEINYHAEYVDLNYHAEYVDLMRRHKYFMMYDYSSQSEHELSVKKDEILTLFDSAHQEWWYMANSDGKKGYVPSNYVANAN